jgi:hypothetical protein
MICIALELPIKVIVSIPEFDLFPCSRITPDYRFHLTYSCTYLELFLRGQSMQVHDLAKYEWSLFFKNGWNLLKEIVVYDD